MYGHYPENSPNDTAIVIPAKAGIQFPAPAISLAATERPSSFSCFVVSVATDMRDYPENNPNDTAIVITLKIAVCDTAIVIPAKAGIQFPAPAASLAATERPSSFSCFVVSVTTDMRDSSENKPRPTVFVGTGFKPAPHYQRHPHTVIPAEAGIQSPAICRARTERPTPFS